MLRDAARGVYKRLVLKDGKLIGVVLYGDVVARRLVVRPVEARRRRRGRARDADVRPGAAEGAPANPTAAVAALPDEAEICGCNGVCKGKIVETIKAKGLKALDEVRAHTKASASCGSCTGLVEQILGLRSARLMPRPRCSRCAAAPRSAMTTCGASSSRRRSSRFPPCMQALEWKTPDGCAKCRPALNYYLLVRLAGRI